MFSCRRAPWVCSLPFRDDEDLKDRRGSVVYFNISESGGFIHSLAFHPKLALYIPLLPMKISRPFFLWWAETCQDDGLYHTHWMPLICFSSFDIDQVWADHLCIWAVLMCGGPGRAMLFGLLLGMGSDIELKLVWLFMYLNRFDGNLTESCEMLS